MIVISKIIKLYFLIFLSILFIPCILRANQIKAPTDHYIGIKVGMGVSNFLYSSEIGTDAKTRKYDPGIITSVDIIYDIDFKGRFISFFAQAGLAVSDFTEIKTESIYRMHYFNLAIGLNVFIYRSLFFGAGPYFGAFINGQRRDENYKKYFRHDFGVILKAGMFFKIIDELKFLIELEARLGFINICNEPGNDRRLHTIMLAIGISVNI
jgi:hypothetical protein